MDYPLAESVHTNTPEKQEEGDLQILAQNNDDLDFAVDSFRKHTGEGQEMDLQLSLATQRLLQFIDHSTGEVVNI